MESCEQNISNSGEERLPDKLSEVVQVSGLGSLSLLFFLFVFFAFFTVFH